MQSEELASLPVGTEVSAKYKGAFCEAKVKKVNKNVLCKVTFKQGLGSYDLYDSQLTYTTSLTVNCTVEAKHPEKGSLHEATINKIIDKSQYTVVFDDGDIATLRRNALRMKSGKHFNASESLDNLPLTHPEHFGTPVGSRRRGKFEEEEEEEEEEDTTDDEADLVPYNQKIGSVVCVEVPDKKSSKSKENWFPGLVVSPYAVSQEQGKLNTKEDFLVRSFKDNKFHTVPRTECKKFHKDMGRGVSDSAMVKALEHAQAYINNNETLPVHWDKEILLEMREESTTEGESEDEELILSDDDELPSEEKDHLVAELYKHMDERGTPINKNPCIGDQDVDLFKLFRFVQKLGGQHRVTNNNQWRVVAKKLGFETNWCVNQVRVCYKRYLQSFEELNRTLGCTLINHPRTRHNSGRPLVRGVRTSSKVKDEDDKSSVSSQEGGDLATAASVAGKKEDICDEIDLDGVKQKPETDEKKVKKAASNVIDKIVKDEPLEEEVEIFDASKRGKETKGKKGKEERMLTRPRRDSSSSLAAATELKAKKDEIGESLKLKRESKKEFKKSKDEDDRSDSGGSGPLRGTKTKKLIMKKKQEEEAFDAQDDECNSDLDNVGKKKKVQKKKGNKAAELAPVEPMAGDDGEEPQHLKLSVECSPGDKIKVFWLHGQIYEAKIIKTDKNTKDKWPKYYVHYQGWNQRYDEWITRGRIAENLTWNTANPQKHSKSSKSSTPPPDKTRQRDRDKQEKRSSDEDEKRDSDERVGSEEEKEEGTRRKPKSARSSTPSSTPSSSRTSSPAHNKRTKSPAPRRPNSPKDSKEKTPGREKKGILNRTNSPAQRKSPLLKRQSSRNSLNKQSDDDFEISEPEEEEEPVKPAKKPVKPQLKEAADSKPETPKRTKSDQRGKKQSTEPEKEEEKKSEQNKTVMRSRRSNTPTKKQHDDPYVFQEPEPIEPMGPFVKIENISAAEIAKQTKSDTTAFQTDIATKMKNDESDAKVEDSKNETEAKTTETIKTEDIKEETKTEEEIQTRADTDKMTEDDKSEESLKDEVKEEEEVEDGKTAEKPDLRSSLFPHLASLRPGTASTTSSHDSSPDTEVTSTIHIDSATMINSIVESSILKESREVKASSSGSDTKKETVSVGGPLADLKEESKDDVSTEVPSPPRQRTRKKKSTKVRNLRNPTHKSREVVTDSDTESEDEKPKAKPVTPRRKTIETERVKTPKRTKELDSDEDDGQSSKKVKRRKEEEEDSLVCQETLPGSPVQVCSTEVATTTKVTTGREERSSSRVELPFASVAAVTAGAEAGAGNMKAGLTGSLKASDSPPATPESPVSVESPLTRSRKEDGRKSPADSSEVDLESLGKAGSEDSRMDIECSSSSDTKTGRGRRRQTASKDVEKEEEKTFQSGKRKRKSRGDSSGRGRGKGRGRNSSGVGRSVGRHNEDSEDSEREGRSQEEPRLDRLDNAALAALATPKPNSTSKYNFYVMLNPEMEPSERISKLQKTIEELRTTYLNIKGDLCAIERRRKKIRRKERERTHQTTEVAV